MKRFLIITILFLTGCKHQADEPQPTSNNEKMLDNTTWRLDSLFIATHYITDFYDVSYRPFSTNDIDSLGSYEFGMPARYSWFDPEKVKKRVNRYNQMVHYTISFIPGSSINFIGGCSRHFHSDEWRISGDNEISFYTSSKNIYPSTILCKLFVLNQSRIIIESPQYLIQTIMFKGGVEGNLYRYFIASKVKIYLTKLG